MYIKRPSTETLDRLLAEARQATPTYAHVGATKGDSWPAGYRADRDEVLLGRDGEIFDRAVAAVRRWQAQRGAGIEVIPEDASVAEGETTLLLIHALGLWTVAPCRVVYVQDEPELFAFAYATLPGHPEEGEASFAVARLADGQVQFRVASFSRPVAPLARISRPLARRVQRRITLGYLSAIASASLTST